MIAATCLAARIKSARRIFSSGACGLESGFDTPDEATGNPSVAVNKCIGPLPVMLGLIIGSDP